MKLLTKLCLKSPNLPQTGELLPHYNVKCNLCKESVTVRFLNYYPADYSALSCKEKTEVSLVCNNVYCGKHRGEVHFLNFGLGREHPTFPMWCIDNTKYPVDSPTRNTPLLDKLKTLWHSIFGKPGYKKGDILPQYSIRCYPCKGNVSVLFHSQLDEYDNKIDVTLVCATFRCKRHKGELHTLDFGIGDDYPTFPWWCEDISEKTVTNKKPSAFDHDAVPVAFDQKAGNFKLSLGKKAEDRLFICGKCGTGINYQVISQNLSDVACTFDCSNLNCEHSQHLTNNYDHLPEWCIELTEENK